MNSASITFLASFLIWFMFLQSGIFLLKNKVRSKKVLGHITCSVLISWLISQVIKILWPVKRPFMVKGVQALTLTTPLDGSFPSGHSAIAFSLASSVYLHDKKLGTFLLLEAALVALGRVLSHVHYIEDVVAGALIGITAAFYYLTISKQPIRLLKYVKNGRS